MMMINKQAGEKVRTEGEEKVGWGRRKKQRRRKRKEEFEKNN